MLKLIVQISLCPLAYLIHITFQIMSVASLRGSLGFKILDPVIFMCFYLLYLPEVSPPPVSYIDFYVVMEQCQRNEM